jgi:hypothetical protein
MRALSLLCVLACGAPEGDAEAGVVQGVVRDAAGEPLAGVKITVENTVFHASYVYGESDAAGRYRVEVPSGSWKVHAQLTRDYHAQELLFDLAPDSAPVFAGTAGAIVDFTWRLSGPRGAHAGEGHYGARLSLYRGDFEEWFELHDLEVTLSPDGPLPDGSAGQTIVASPAENSDLVDDVPVGRYTVSVRHRTGGPRPVRVRNRGEYGARATVMFAPPFPGSSRYGVELEVASGSR